MLSTEGKISMKRKGGNSEKAYLGLRRTMKVDEKYKRASRRFEDRKRQEKLKAERMAEARKMGGEMFQVTIQEKKKCKRVQVVWKQARQEVR
jgi:hypothetical protein